MDQVSSLYDAILQTRNADPRFLREHEEALNKLLNTPGVLLRLQTIAVTPSLDLSARQLAIIQAKNITHLQWKAKSKNPEADLPLLRQNMLRFVDEPDEVLARNNEMMLAKAARLDYPARWPTLLGEIQSIIQTNLQARFSSPNPDSQTLLRLRRSLRMLNAVLKEFTSMKSPLGTQITTKATGEIYPFLSEVASQISAHVDESLSALTNPTHLTAYDMEISHISWKCWSKLMLWAWNKNKMVTETERQAFEGFFSRASTHTRQLWEYRKKTALAIQASVAAGAPPDSTVEQFVLMMNKHIKALGKVFRKMQQRENTGLSRFCVLPGCLELVHWYWVRVQEATDAPPDFINDTVLAVYPVQFIVQALAIFKTCVGYWSPTKRVQNPSADGFNEALSQDFVSNAVRILISRFMPLKPSDLEKWEENPEDFLNTEEKDNEQWEFDIRPCSERVLMTLVSQYPDYVTPLVQNLFQNVVFSIPNDLNAILEREAVYCALGRCVHRMKAVINFDEWLPILEKEAQNPNPAYRLMKRRIAWLLGKWHHDDSRPTVVSAKVYEILLYFLTDRSDATDPVVRLATATALWECVENNDFELEAFKPYLAPLLGGLFQMIDEAEAVESKSRIFKTINSVIGQARTEAVPLIPAISERVPQLWQQAEDEYMLKQAILLLVKDLVEATGEHSVALQPLIVPLIQESLAVGARAQLDTDAIDLWEASLRFANTLQGPAGQRGLFDLLPLVVNMLEHDLDVLGTANRLMESYYLLDAGVVLQACAPQLLAAYTKAHQSAISTNIKDITESLELMIQLSPSAMSWAPSMHSSGLFATLLAFPLIGKGSISVLCDHFHVFSRMALQDPNVFVQLVVEAAPARSETPEQTLDHLLDSWWRNFDSMAEPRHRKLTAMAMASLGTTGRPEIVKRLPTEIANVWLDVLAEIKEAESDDPENPSPLHNYWADSNEPPNYWMRNTEDTLEGVRRLAVWANDPVQSVKLTTFIEAKLKEASERLGPTVWQTEFMDKSDPAVLKQLMGYLAN